MISKAQVMASFINDVLVLIAMQRPLVPLVLVALPVLVVLLPVLVPLVALPVALLIPIGHG